MFALADVDGFYANCEKMFRPNLHNRPVMVLSNNDDCIIACSAEAKRLGIKVGASQFQLKTAQFSEPVITFPSNYELYTSTFNRVTSCLEELTPRVERYNINEMSLDIRGIDDCMDLEGFGRQLCEHARSGTGLTIGVGTGPTKTLAKSAQWASKEWRQLGDVLALTSDSPERTKKLLLLQPVDEIWGVGRRIPKKLSIMGVTTALQLARANPVSIRRNSDAVLERTVREFSGGSCISLEEAPPSKQQIICSRSFGERVAIYEAIRQAVYQYVERVTEKLRGKRQFCRHITVFVETPPFVVNEPYYGNVASERLTTPMRDIRDIITAAAKALDQIWVNDHQYAKAGRVLDGLTPTGVPRLNLFDDIQPRSSSSQPMKVIDGISYSRLGKVWFAGRDIVLE